MNIAQTPGWAQFVATLPAGKAKTLALAGLDTQCDPLTLHPDQTLRTALITTHPLAAGNYELLYDPAPSALSPMAAPMWPSATVEFVIGSATFTATLPPWTDGPRVADGPLCIERDLVIAPVDAAGKEHPYLQVFFDVVSFRDQAGLLDINIHNGRDVPGRSALSYTATVTVNGSRVFGPQAETHYSFAVWSVSASTRGHIASRVDPDPEMYVAAGVFPRLVPGVNQTGYNPTGAAYGPLQFGYLQYSQGTPGGRPELGPMTAVTAQYLTYRGAEQRAQVLVDGTLAGSWCAAAMEADGVTPIMLSRHAVDYSGPANGAGVGPNLALNGPHLPSLTPLPYLLTGRRRYLRSLQAWACTVLWQLYPLPANTSERNPSTNVEFSRQGAKGIMAPNFASEPRGWGWCLRTVADAAVLTPDAQSELKTYLTSVVVNNLAWLDAYAALPGGGAFNPLFWEFDNGKGEGGTGTVHTGYVQTAPWQSSYLFNGIWHCKELGFPTTNAALLRGCNTDVLLYTAAAATKNEDYPRIASRYYPRYGTNSGGVIHMFGGWAEFYNANYMLPGDDHDVVAPPFPRAPGPPYFAAEGRLTLIYAERLGLPGATAALDWIENVYGGIDSTRPGYLIARSQLAGQPSPVPVPPVVLPVTPPTSGKVVTATIRASQKEANLDPKTLTNTLLITLSTPAPPVVVPPPPPSSTGSPQVRVSYNPSAVSLAPGQTAKVQAIANNAGPGAATEEVVSLGFPAEVEVIDAGANYDKAADKWAIGEIPGNTIVAMDVSLRAKA